MKLPSFTITNVAIVFVVIIITTIAIRQSDSMRKENRLKLSIDQMDSTLTKQLLHSDKVQETLCKIDSSLRVQILKHDLKNYKEFYAYLVARKIPFASYWTAISILECGWSWESEHARLNHNILGFNQCYFTSKQECADFAMTWMALNPPTLEEIKQNNAESFFRRRGYNSVNPVYYIQVSQIVTELETIHLWSWN